GIGRAQYEVDTELIASGMRWVILRPHAFMQNLLDQTTTIVREGRLFAASGDGKVPLVDTRDIAAVAAVVLTSSGHDGKKYVLTGPEALSYFDVARFLSETAGRRITYVPLSIVAAPQRMDRDAPPPCPTALLTLLMAF